jgi:hypothetical protein
VWGFALKVHLALKVWKLHLKSIFLITLSAKPMCGVKMLRSSTEHKNKTLMSSIFVFMMIFLFKYKFKAIIKD